MNESPSPAPALGLSSDPSEVSGNLGVTLVLNSSPRVSLHAGLPPVWEISSAPAERAVIMHVPDGKPLRALVHFDNHRSPGSDLNRPDFQLGYLPQPVMGGNGVQLPSYGGQLFLKKGQPGTALGSASSQ